MFGILFLSPSDFGWELVFNSSRDEILQEDAPIASMKSSKKSKISFYIFAKFEDFSFLMPWNSYKCPEFGEEFFCAFTTMEEFGIFSVKYFPYLAKFWLSISFCDTFMRTLQHLAKILAIFVLE